MVRCGNYNPVSKSFLTTLQGNGCLSLFTRWSSKATPNGEFVSKIPLIYPHNEYDFVPIHIPLLISVLIGYRYGETISLPFIVLLDFHAQD